MEEEEEEEEEERRWTMMLISLYMTADLFLRKLSIP